MGEGSYIPQRTFTFPPLPLLHPEDSQPAPFYDPGRDSGDCVMASLVLNLIMYTLAVVTTGVLVVIFFPETYFIL